MICSKCNGIDSELCPKCLGTIEVDWVENIVGKQSSKTMSVLNKSSDDIFIADMNINFKSMHKTYFKVDNTFYTSNEFQNAIFNGNFILDYVE